MCAVILFSASAKLKDDSVFNANRWLYAAWHIRRPGNLSARMMDHHTQFMGKLPLLLMSPRSDSVVRWGRVLRAQGHFLYVWKGTLHLLVPHPAGAPACFVGRGGCVCGWCVSASESVGSAWLPPYFLCRFLKIQHRKPGPISGERSFRWS